MHRFAAMRGDPPIPEIDVTRPARPTIAAAQESIEAHPPCTGANDPVAAAPEPAPEFVEGDGWIEWKGGECPVSEDTLISYKCRNGFECGTGLAKYYMWWHSSHPRDIIAYKVLP